MTSDVHKAILATLNSKRAFPEVLETPYRDIPLTAEDPVRIVITLASTGRKIRSEWFENGMDWGDVRAALQALIERLTDQ